MADRRWLAHLLEGLLPGASVVRGPEGELVPGTAPGDNVVGPVVGAGPLSEWFAGVTLSVAGRVMKALQSGCHCAVLPDAVAAVARASLVREELFHFYVFGPL